MSYEVTKIKRQIQGSLAIEGSEVNLDILEDVPEADTTSAEAIETIGDVVEVERLDEQAEELETIDELGGELVAAVESAIATGRGLSPIEAAALKLTTRQITQKYSPTVAELIPAREDFGGRQDALDTTVLACESLTGSFQTFWEAAKKHFMTVIEAIQKLFRKIVGMFTSVTKRAQALKARAEQAEEIPAGTVKMQTNDLVVGSQSLNTAVPEGLRNILDLVTSLLRTSRQIDDRAEINKGVEAIKEKDAWSGYVQGVNNYARRTFDAIDSAKDGVSTLLPGNRAITFTEGTPGGRDQFSFEALIRFGEEKEKVEDVQALSRKEIIDVADLIIAIAEQISQYDKIWSRNTQKASRLIQGINAAAKSKFSEKSKAEGGDVTEQTTDEASFKVNVSALIAHVRHLDKFSSDLIAFAESVSSLALAYGEKSLSDVNAGKPANAPVESTNQ